jgi:hypothetical protein
MICAKCGEPIEGNSISRAQLFKVGDLEHYHPDCWYGRRKSGVRERPPGTQHVTPSQIARKTNLLPMPGDKSE